MKSVRRRHACLPSGAVIRRIQDKRIDLQDVASILQGLNPAQREAVLTPGGPLLVIAGPGSGKTRVIAHRIAYLVATGISPRRILAATFTNKAAREMRERVAALVGDAVHQATLGTFHATCARILRAHGYHRRLERGFAIYDDKEQLEVMRRALKEMSLDPQKTPPRAVLATISRAKAELQTPEAYARTVKSYFQEVVARLYERYQELLVAVLNDRREE